MENIAHKVQSRVVKLILHHFSFKWTESVKVLTMDGSLTTYLIPEISLYKKKVQQYISDFLHGKEMLMQQMEESCQHKLNM